MFQNKVIWITGASSGIGEALTIALAKTGAKIVLSARREAELQRVQQSAGLTPENSLILPMDMLATDTFFEKTQMVLQRFGKIDYLYHNAGISQRGFLKDTPFAVDKQLMDVNFMGVVALTKAVLPSMLAQQAGHFVITSSIVGKLGTPMRSAYSASKHALHGFFDSLRAELWREGIQVTLVCPGYIHTNVSVNAVREDGKAFGKMDENQQKGMNANIFAKKMIRAVERGKHEVAIGGVEVIGVYLKRFSPALLWRMIRNYNIKSHKNL